MDQESITLEIDPRSVLAAVKQANQAVEGWEKQTIGSGDKMQKSLDRMSEMLLKMNDRSRSSMERLTQSIENQAAAHGKTGAERLIADRDRLIKKLGDEQGMIDRVTAAYATMIAAESGGGAGRWQQFGDVVKSGAPAGSPDFWKRWGPWGRRCRLAPRPWWRTARPPSRHEIAGRIRRVGEGRRAAQRNHIYLAGASANRRGPGDASRLSRSVRRKEVDAGRVRAPLT
jgi:hypothetical protein